MSGQASDTPRAMTMRFVGQWARWFRGPLALIALVSVLSSLAALAVPWLAAQALGEVVTTGSNGGAADTPPLDLARIIALLVTALVLLTVLTISTAILSERAAARILTELRERIYSHVQMLRIGFHDEANAGDILALTSYEVGDLGDFLASTLAKAPAMLLTAAGALVMLAWIDMRLALIVPLLIPAFYVAARLAGRRLRHLSHQARAADAALVARVERDLAMLPAIKAYATEAHARAGFAAAAERARLLMVRQAQLNSVIGPMMALLAALAAIAMLVWGGEQLTANRAPGDIFAFLFYAALLTRPVGDLANMYGAYQMASGTLARMEGVLALEQEPGHDSGTQIERATGDIALDNVHFAYRDRAPIFAGLTLTIKAGETIALTGDNGVGKSTIMRLLLRYYDPQSGHIMLDGQDIRTLQIQSLRRQFGYVPQRPLLFDGTIAENIAFGQSDTDSPEAAAAIARAAQLAQADRFINDLPHGMATRIGDHGVRLSGGQQQRIALARALLRDPPIYILDEATSMYDLDSEAAFVEQAMQTLGDRTVIIITHRPASLALADRVLKLTPDGRIGA